MKAVVWRGDRTLDIETVEDARIEAPTDVLMRITSTAIWGFIAGVLLFIIGIPGLLRFFKRRGTA
jgi:hypothetical protein